MVDNSPEHACCLPKNLSNEGSNYHTRFYYPTLVYQRLRARLKMEQAYGQTKIDQSGSGTAAHDGEEKLQQTESTDVVDMNCHDGERGGERAQLVLSDTETNYSEDYTQMTDGEGSDFAGRVSVSSDEFSDRSSLSTLENNDHDFPALDGMEEELQKIEDSDDGFEPPTININTETLEDPPPSPTIMTGPDAMASADAMNGSEEGGMYEDREFDFLKQEPIRRSTSLKTYKTPPGTPRRKKAVRFADALGLDLESVRHILNLEQPPKIPESAMKDLKVGIEVEQKDQGLGSRYLTACFPQPGANHGFPQRVIDHKVALENCLVDDQEMTVSGTIRVANIGFHKQVVVRQTYNNWITFSDIQATYVLNSNDGPTDRFSFTFTVPPYFDVGSRVVFAVQYNVNGQTYWDNNFGGNYVVECYARALPATESDRTWIHFL